MEVGVALHTFPCVLLVDGIRLLLTVFQALELVHLFAEGNSQFDF